MTHGALEPCLGLALTAASGRSGRALSDTRIESTIATNMSSSVAPRRSADSRSGRPAAGASWKRVALDTALRLRVDAALAPLTRGRAAIFMLHRFRDDANGVAGHDPAVLRRALAHLRASRFELVPLEDLVRRLAGEGPPLRRAVAFTIDDGYLDQATIAAPVFAEFDCPVTTFVTSGFLDGALWFWWDRIEYVFTMTARTRLALPIEDGELHWIIGDAASRERGRAEMVEYCKTIPDGLKHALIARLAEAGEVEIPARAPARYQPMSWSDLRRCETIGMSFGPHTVTHPIMSRTSDAQCEFELRESWDRLRAEAHAPVPVFCYPNGQPADFGAREAKLLQTIGLAGAVVGQAGYADRAAFRRGPEAPYRIRRFSFPDDLPTLVQIASGIEHLKRVVRGEGND